MVVAGGGRRTPAKRTNTSPSLQHLGPAGTRRRAARQDRPGRVGEGEELSAGRSGATIAKAADLSSPSPIRFVEQARVTPAEDRCESPAEILLRSAAGEIANHQCPLERQVCTEARGVPGPEQSCEFHGTTSLPPLPAA